MTEPRVAADGPPDAESAPIDAPVWDDGVSDGYPPLDHPTEAELVVVGLGGSGLAAVTWAVEQGIDVLGIDAGTVAAEAAGRNGGFLLAGPERPYHTAVADYGRTATRDFYALSEQAIDAMAASFPGVVRRVGSLRIGSGDSETTDVAADLAARRDDGFAVEPYTGLEGSGFVVPGDAAMNPLQRVRLGLRRAVSGGARLHEHTRATSLLQGEVRTAAGVIRCGSAVVAVDGRLETLVPSLRGRIRTARLQMLSTAPLPELTYRRPVYANWGYVYWQQLPDRRLVIGGHRQLHEDAEWTTQPGPTQDVQSELDAELRRLGVTAPVTHRWAGHSAYTVDRRPVFEEIHPRMVVVGGYSGHGNVTGGLYATEAARYVVNGRRHHALLG